MTALKTSCVETQVYVDMIDSILQSMEHSSVLSVRGDLSSKEYEKFVCKKVGKIIRCGNYIFVNIVGEDLGIAIDLGYRGKVDFILNHDKQPPSKLNYGDSSKFRLFIGNDSIRDLTNNIYSVVNFTGGIDFDVKIISLDDLYKETDEGGPDPLSVWNRFDFDKKFIEIITSKENKNRSLYDVLLDIKCVVRLGTLYAGEILFKSMFSPDKKIKTMSETDLNKFSQRIVSVVLKQYVSGGSINEFNKNYCVAKGGKCIYCSNNLEKYHGHSGVIFWCEKCQEG